MRPIAGNADECGSRAARRIEVPVCHHPGIVLPDSTVRIRRSLKIQRHSRSDPVDIGVIQKHVAASRRSLDGARRIIERGRGVVDPYHGDARRICGHAGDLLAVDP